MTLPRLLAALCAALIGASVAAAPVPAAPLIDYHQHLVSPAFARVVKLPELDGAALLARMDAAGVRQAVVLSVAYSMADDRKAPPDPDGLVRAENGWTSRQIAASHGRLIGFCSVNPLRDAAPAELRRCLGLPGMVGLKLHFGNSGVSLRNPAHVARLVPLFEEAARRRAPVLVHMRARGGDNYGAPDARLFIDRLLPMVPDSDVIVAHFGGGGAYPAQADAVMGVFADAFRRHDPRVRRTFFDLATVVMQDVTASDAARIARRIREIGPVHILYGSDLLTPDALPIAEQWRLVTEKLGLTAAELRVIADQRLPFVDRDAPTTAGAAVGGAAVPSGPGLKPGA